MWSRERVAPRTLIYLVLVTNARGRKFYASGAFGSCSSKALSQSYRDIASRTKHLDRWPDSKNFCQDCLVFDQGLKSYKLPTFLDGHGPLGVFGLLHDNPQADGILRPCDDIFTEFCAQLKIQVLKNDVSQVRAMDRWILHPPPSSHHISVAILQEHISFLKNQADIDNWQPISHSTIQQLADSLMSEQQSKVVVPPELELDSLLWTPDGALIAGFIDNNPEESFEKLRSSSRQIAQDILGNAFLATRPKTLIHSTIGRVVGLPPGSTSTQYDTLTNIAQEYNERILPDAVQDIKMKHPSFTLDKVSLARNIVWMLQEYEVIQTWSVGS